MNIELFESLLNEDESSSLDFKRDQYPFVEKHQKSELLKDILSFANAWRRTDAYILIGVDEVVGGPSTVTGISTYLDEANLQQFVNSKVNRPVTFSYSHFQYNGKQVGIIKIPLQQRPFYLSKDYGKLRKNVVYLRRGSSTDIANPDEIAKMGAYSLPSNLGSPPLLELQFADKSGRSPLGSSIHLAYTLPKLPPTKDIPELHRIKNTYFINQDFSMTEINPDFYSEYAEYLLLTEFWKPVALVLSNRGSVLAENVRMETEVLFKTDFKFLEEYDYPSEQKDSRDRYLAVNPLKGLKLNTQIKEVSIDQHSNKWFITCSFGSIQPKADSWSDIFYFGAERDQKVELEVRLFADNLPEPSNFKLVIETTCKWKEMTVDELVALADKFRKQNNK